MIDNFHRHRAQFEKLREKVCGLSYPQVVMMDPEWSRPAISQAEKQEYYALFEEVDAHGVQATPQPCAIWVEVWSTGLGGDGDYKKYRFGPAIHSPMINSQDLDADGGSRNEITFYQRQIEGDWWLEFDHWP